MVPRSEEVRISSVRRIGSLPFAGLLLLGLLVSGFAAPAPDFLRFLAALAVAVWIPGVIVARDLLGVRAPSVFVRYPLYFFAGASAASVATWPFVVAGAGFGGYEAAYLTLVAALFIVGAVVSWRRGAGAAAGGGRRALAALLILAAVAALQPGAPGVEQDAFDHIGYIRHIESEATVSPAGVLAPREGDAAAMPPDPRKGTYHVVLALVASLARVDPLVMWAFQPLVLFPLAFFAFLAFCRVFVSRPSHLVWCVILFALSYGGVGYRYPESVAYGQNLAVSWYWLLVPLVVTGTGTTRGRELLLLAVLGAGGTWVHFGVLLHVLVLAATVLVFARLTRADSGVAYRAVALGVAAAVAAAWKVAWVHGDPNVVHMHDQGLLYIGDWFVVSPLEVLRQHGMLFLGGLVLVPFLLRLRARMAARRALAFALLPVLVCFVPFVTTPLVNAATYMVSRTLLNVPVIPVIVLVIGATVQAARARGLFTKALVAAALIGWGLIFVAPTIRAAVRELPGPHAAKPSPVPRELIDYVRRLPSESVILSDTRTAYHLSAMTPHHYVAIHGQHANPLDPYALDRLEAVRDVLSPYAMSRRAVAGCDRYGVDFVICNAVSEARSGEFLSTWDSADYALTVARLDAIAGRFRRVHEGADFSVFLYDPSGTGESVWGPPGPLFSDTPVAGMHDCRVAAPGAAFDVRSVGVTPVEVLPGETVEVTLGYEKTGQVSFGIGYVIQLRLDHESIGRGADYPGAKHVRRARERRGGKMVRLTRPHVPLDGRLGVDLWPIGREFYETIDLALPATMVPGDYTLRVTIERESLLPNFDVRDLLFNRDRLEGEACATIRVTRRRVREP